MSASSRIFEATKWGVTAAVPVLKLTAVFMPGRVKDETITFALFAVTEALPEIAIMACALWLLDVLVKYWASIRLSLQMPPSLLRNQPYRRGFVIAALFLSFVCGVTVSGKNAF